MDFTIKRIDLLAAIDKCAIAVPGDHQNNAFNVVRMEGKASKKKVKLSAVGEVAAVDTVVEADVKEPGFFNVLPKRLRDIAASMPDGRVQFLLKGTRVTVKSLVSSRKATFESLTVDPFRVDDPGKDAAWLRGLDSKELERGLRVVKPMSTWEDRDDPTVSLLVPTERGLDIFGCNGYQIAVVETSIRVEGDPIQMPGPAVEVLFKMTDIDDKVSLFADSRRVYLENCDTLVSAALPVQYLYQTTHEKFTAFLKGTDGQERKAGPVFDPGKLLSGVKSVLALGGFASADERKKGMGIHLHLGHDTVSVELSLGVADAKDEFPTISPGGELESLVDSSYLLKVLGSLGAVTEVKAYHTSDEMMLVLQTAGITAGMMKRVMQ